MKKRSFVVIIGFLALILILFASKFVSAQQGISAIDVLLDPDQTMIDSAKVYNKIMQQNYSGPGSYSLDAAHNPHITVLQCFVKTAELDKVYAAVL